MEKVVGSNPITRSRIDSGRRRPDDRLFPMAATSGPEPSPDRLGSPWAIERVDPEDVPSRHPDKPELLLRSAGETVEVPQKMLDELAVLHRKIHQFAGDAIPSTPEAFLEAVVGKLPSELPWDEYDHAAFTIDFGEPIGLEKVTSRAEMKQRGLITADDERLLDDEELVEAVRRVNVSGDSLAKSRVVDESYLRGYRGNIRLALRGDSAKSVVPVYCADWQPTTELFVVVVQEQDRDKTVHRRLRKLVPGRKMPRLPSDVRFHAREDVEGMSKRISVYGLQEQMAAGRELSVAEERLVIEQHWAQERWWENGFLKLDDSPEEIAEVEGPSLMVVVGPPGYTEDYLDRKAPDMHHQVDWSDDGSRRNALDTIKQRLQGGEVVFVRVPSAKHRLQLTRMASIAGVPAKAMLIDVEQRGWDVCVRDSDGDDPGTWQSYAAAMEKLVYQGSYTAERFSAVWQLTPAQAERIDRFESGER